MNKLLIALFFVCFVGSKGIAQSQVTFKVSTFAINKQEVLLEKPLVIESTFKKKSDVYPIGKADNEEVGVRFTMVKEGTGKQKYWVYQTEFMHQHKGRWINLCNTPRHKMNGPYHLKSYFECKYDAAGHSFEIAYEVDANQP